MTALFAEFAPAFYFAFAVISAAVIYITGSQSGKAKEIRKRTEENAEASITAKEKLIEVVAADDDEFARRLRASERR